MTAPSDRNTAPALDPILAQVAAISVALPPSGTQTAVPQPAGDVARIVLGAGTEISQVCVVRQGESLIVTAPGYGQLVIRNAPANSPNPPEVADTHGRIVPAESIGIGCSIPGSLTDVAPASGAIDPAALAAAAPAAGPEERPAELTGGHFNSTFDPAQLLGLSYGPVDPLTLALAPTLLLVPVTTIETALPPETVAVVALDMLSNSAEADIPTIIWEQPSATARRDPDLLSSADLQVDDDLDIAPGVWSPLTVINSSLNGGAGSIAQVQITVTGLGDGVALNLAAPLSAGWTLATFGLDADGNGSYALLPSSGAASSAAFAVQLAKLQVTIAGDTAPSHADVTIQFVATNSAGLTDASTSVLDIGSAGVSPPAPAEVHVAAGPLPPPSPTIEQLITS